MVMKNGSQHVTPEQQGEIQPVAACLRCPSQFSGSLLREALGDLRDSVAVLPLKDMFGSPDPISILT